VPFLSALEVVTTYDDALYKSTFILLYCTAVVADRGDCVQESVIVSA